MLHRLCSVFALYILAATPLAASPVEVTFTFGPPVAVPDVQGSQLPGDGGLAFSPDTPYSGLELYVTAGTSLTGNLNPNNMRAFHDGTPKNGGLGVIPQTGKSGDNLDPGEVLFFSLTLDNDPLEFEVTAVEMNGEHVEINTALTDVYRRNGLAFVSALMNPGTNDLLPTGSSFGWAIRNVADPYDKSYVESVTIRFDPFGTQTTVPEPTSLAVFGLVVLTGGAIYRRRQRKTAAE